MSNGATGTVLSWWGKFGAVMNRQVVTNQFTGSDGDTEVNESFRTQCTLLVLCLLLQQVSSSLNQY
jgi:hypothetical protein